MLWKMLLFTSVAGQQTFSKACVQSQDTGKHQGPHNAHLNMLRGVACTLSRGHPPSHMNCGVCQCRAHRSFNSDGMG